MFCGLTLCATAPVHFVRFRRLGNEENFDVTAIAKFLLRSRHVSIALHGTIVLGREHTGTDNRIAALVPLGVGRIGKSL